MSQNEVVAKKDIERRRVADFSKKKTKLCLRCTKQQVAPLSLQISKTGTSVELEGLFEVNNLSAFPNREKVQY